LAFKNKSSPIFKSVLMGFEEEVLIDRTHFSRSSLGIIGIIFGGIKKKILVC